MGHYMFVGRYTPATLKTLIGNPQDREKAARPLIEAMGGKLHSLFFAFGAEDVYAIMEMPDDESAAAAAMVVAGSGAMSSGQTVKLMTSAEAMAAMARAGKTTGAYSPPA